MSNNDITYIGISKESENRSTKKKSKNEVVFKPRKRSINISNRIAKTKSSIFNKKLLLVVLIACLIYIIKPITFLRTKLDEKREYYAQNYSSTPFSTEIGLMDSLVYLSGIDYYKNCKDTLVMPADGMVTWQYDWAHQGIDIACDNYQDNVYAAAAGTVCYVGYSEKYGNELMIKHEINGMTLYTFYGNLSVVNVTNNQYVTPNQVIALEGGNPERKATIMDDEGHHVHFEVRKSQDPNNSLNPNILIK